jgi:predicted transcriptional regulator
MISVNNTEFLHEPIRDHVISSEKVAHVQVGNNAEHALLVLTKTGYSAIPVLDHEYRLRGLLSMGMITESILGLERIEYERLSNMKVDELMQTDLPIVGIDTEFRRVFDLLINHPFLCVEDEEGMFAGIMTRRVLMKKLKKAVYTMPR